MKVTYATAASDDLRRLQRSIARRIVEKVAWFASQSDPLRFSLPLQSKRLLYRFRIGAYRVLFTVQKGTVVILLVLAVKHRREAYR
ncbi:MAG: type II toxin-antitoxin system RelE/ParE family toxin [Candidatus Peregrinibacteria bacterium]